MLRRQTIVLPATSFGAIVTYEVLQLRSRQATLLRHRKPCIDAMTATPVTILHWSSINFQLLPGTSHGRSRQLKLLSNGTASYRGDFNANGGPLIVADFNVFTTQSGVNQYVRSDCTFDGNVTVHDFNIFMSNAPTKSLSKGGTATATIADRFG